MSGEKEKEEEQSQTIATTFRGIKRKAEDDEDQQPSQEEVQQLSQEEVQQPSQEKVQQPSQEKVQQSSQEEGHKSKKIRLMVVSDQKNNKEVEVTFQVLSTKINDKQPLMLESKSQPEPSSSSGPTGKKRKNIKDDEDDEDNDEGDKETEQPKKKKLKPTTSSVTATTTSSSTIEKSTRAESSPPPPPQSEPLIRIVSEDLFNLLITLPIAKKNTEETVETTIKQADVIEKSDLATKKDITTTETSDTISATPVTTNTKIEQANLESDNKENTSTESTTIKPVQDNTESENIQNVTDTPKTTIDPSPVVVSTHQQESEAESPNPTNVPFRKGKERADDTYTEPTEQQKQDQEISQYESMLDYYRSLFPQETSFSRESSPPQHVKLLAEENELSQEEIMQLLIQEASLPLKESSISQEHIPPQQEEITILEETVPQQQEVFTTTPEVNPPQEEADILQESDFPLEEANILQEETDLPQEEANILQEEANISQEEASISQVSNPPQEEANVSLEEPNPQLDSEDSIASSVEKYVEEIPAFRNLVRFKTMPDGRRHAEELIFYTNNGIRPVTAESTNETIINGNDIPDEPNFTVNELKSPPQPQPQSPPQPQPRPQSRPQPRPQPQQQLPSSRGFSSRNPNSPPTTRKEKESDAKILSIDDILKGLSKR